MISPSSGIFDPDHRVGPAVDSPTSLRLNGRRLPTVGTARIYVCGITPYDVTHLGHAATFVWADVLASALGVTGSAVQMCRNVTDVDDVLTAAALDRGRYYDEFALVQEAQFEQSMRALRVTSPAAQPRARHHIAAVQQLAQALLDVDAAYERNGTVWFRGSDVPRSAGVPRDRALELSRAYGDNPDSTLKDDPFDVAVWQPSSDAHPAWPSPWGWGRPGWHAECAAMAVTALGASVDVLVGGSDLAFPHHPYQQAMASAATGVVPFARSVIHVGEVQIGGSKMAKSTGNLVLVDDLLERYDPAALRTFLIDRRFADAWSFEDRDIENAQHRLDRLYSAAGRNGATTVAVEAAIERLRTELDVPGALDIAEQEGGEAARRIISLLRLG